ncbi:MAG: RNA polymerase sigma factor [Pseudomonadales bacterium]|jgi:RNA polymerase sigma-70 factor (ECF subfamily)|nr:RNA polymerase sigma factor [Pseudomonadales bacterium]
MGSFPNYEQDETSLIADLKTGQERAVLWWYNHYSKRLQAFIFSKISKELDVEEITQEVFMKALQNLANFSGRSSLWTWMCAIAKHEIADYYRKIYAKKVLALLPLTENLLTCKIDDADELAEKIEQVWQQVGVCNRELLLQKYIDKRKVAEIARDRGKTSKAIESELWRAREEFKRAYLHLED